MKRLLIVAACFVCAFMIASPASAVTLSWDDLGIGTVVPSVPASESHELVYVNYLIGKYNVNDWSTHTETLFSPHVVALTAHDGDLVPSSLVVADGYLRIDGSTFDVAGWTYLYAKFGTDGALYYLGGGSADQVTSPFGTQGGGLSHITLFNRTTEVPEGATLMLLGFGLAGVGMFRRFMKR